MSEMCIVIDENDKRIGADTKKNCMFKQFLIIFHQYQCQYYQSH